GLVRVVEDLELGLDGLVLREGLPRERQGLVRADLAADRADGAVRGGARRLALPARADADLELVELHVVGADVHPADGRLGYITGPLDAVRLDRHVSVECHGALSCWLRRLGAREHRAPPRSGPRRATRV